MNNLKRISKIFESAEEIPFDDSSRIILMSDVHRGDGGWADDFSKNQNLYFVALTHYYNENYTYIEIGDGDELWKNKNLSVPTRVSLFSGSVTTSCIANGRYLYLFVKKSTINFSIRS